MTELLLRGRTLSFTRWPETANDLRACRYEEDGGVLVRDGRIVTAGGYAEIARQAGPAAKMVDHSALLQGLVSRSRNFR